MEQSNWFVSFMALGGLLGTAVTAVATVLLWRVTKILAKETSRMVDASSKPHIVATIEPNQWALNHANIHVTNTGNATAYNIEICFDPSLQNILEKENPLQKISVLKPGQEISSHLGEFSKILDKNFKVNVKWKRDSKNNHIEENIYQIDFNHLQKFSRLGPASPLIQIAEEAKKIRESWSGITSGSRKLQADIFTTSDRIHERRTRERIRRQIEKEENQ